MTPSEHRVAALRELIAEVGTPAAFCRRFNLDPNYLYQLLNGHRPIGERAAEKLGRQIAGDPLLLDQWKLTDATTQGETREPPGQYAHIEKTRVMRRNVARVQVKFTFRLRNLRWNNKIDSHAHTDAPMEIEFATDDRTAYAIRLAGEIALPGFGPGWYAVAEPTAREPIAGDLCYVELTDGRCTIATHGGTRAGVLSLHTLDNTGPLAADLETVAILHRIRGFIESS